jgi:hypothetical protein
VAVTPSERDVAGSDFREPQSFTLELSLEEMAFLRLLLTNATVQPALLKKLCGEVQGKIEDQIGPLPLP